MLVSIHRGNQTVQTQLQETIELYTTEERNFLLLNLEREDLERACTQSIVTVQWFMPTTFVMFLLYPMFIVLLFTLPIFMYIETSRICKTKQRKENNGTRSKA